MANQRRILTVMLFIAILGVFSWLLLRPDPEPTYQGMPLTYWLERVVRERSVESMESVRQIGTNGIPTFLHMLKARDSKFKLAVIRFAVMHHIINMNYIRFKTAETQHNYALFGFYCLGTQGKSAMPALIEISNKYRPGRDDDAVTIAWIFAGLGPAAADAVPWLVQTITDTNVLNRLIVVEALGKIHSRPELAVPALTGSLRDPDMAVRVNAAFSLGAFESDAKSAVTGLVNALEDTSFEVRFEAASALKQIDPEAAAKAGVK
jgi:hypothetical protein